MADGPVPGPPAYGENYHSQRRENPSTSSTLSGSSTVRSSRSRGGNPAVESAVTRLLVSIKQLLESLTLWSELKASENDVSDVYVRLGNDFNAAVLAFSTHNIDMSDLKDVPEELRAVLEECLSEEATPANLNRFLPGVREIITNLLHGLRTKQSAYRKVVSDGRSGSGHGRTESSRSSRSERASTSSRIPSGRPPSDNPVRRSGASIGSRVSRRKDSVGATPQSSAGSDAFVGGFAPNLGANSPPPREDTVSPRLLPQTPFQPGYGAPSAELDGAQPSFDGLEISRPLPAISTSDNEAPGSPPVQRAPASAKRYSLVDRPIGGPPAVVIDSAEPETPSTRDAPSPPPDTAALETLQSTPGMASSLAALKKDSLERRASKRFSTYTFSKMTGGSVRAPSSHRRSMAAGNALTPGELAVLTEAEESEDVFPSRDESTRSRSRGGSPFKPPPVPPLPASAQTSRAPTPTVVASSAPGVDDVSERSIVAPAPVEAPTTGPATVFLQVGREVKKATIESPAALSLSSLRILFMDKFSYNPGKENFPAIYIRDPSSGIQYQLEDMEEVKPNCLLSLNIEPLDQIKQHIDVQIIALAQDIKDLRSAVSSNQRTSHTSSFAAADQSTSENSPPAPRPSNQAFFNAAKRISRLVADDHTPVAPAPRIPILPQMTGQSLQPQMTGMSVMSEYTSRVVSDLRTQFDEVQNLRRDLGTMRQLYTEFTKQTKEALGTLRTQTQTVRQLAGSKVGGARAYIDAGKTNLDTRSQNVLTKMEELQDTVENVKDDVLKRHVTPKPNVIKQIQKDMDAVAAELASLGEHIKTVKPMWKKTWEEELQNIVEEQQFLSHQEDFLADLLEDHKAVIEVYGHVDKVISIRGSSVRGRGKGPAFRPPPAEEGGGIDQVLLEIRGANVDPERRLKAIAANQRSREKDLQSRSEEFERELITQGRKLNKTGGAEEAERVRQRRNDMTIKAMFTGGSAVSVASSSGPSSPRVTEGEGVQ